MYYLCIHSVHHDVLLLDFSSTVPAPWARSNIKVNVSPFLIFGFSTGLLHPTFIENDKPFLHWLKHVLYIARFSFGGCFPSWFDDGKPNFEAYSWLIVHV